MTPPLVIAVLALATWLYLLLGHGLFWLGRERDDRNEPEAEPARWPSVTAVVPARNEADVIAASISSLLAQDYPGELRVILVDDNSTDGTGDIARALDHGGRLSVISGAPLVQGWTGKLWAVRQGIAAAAAADSAEVCAAVNSPSCVVVSAAISVVASPPAWDVVRAPSCVDVSQASCVVVNAAMFAEVSAANDVAASHPS